MASPASAAKEALQKEYTAIVDGYRSLQAEFQKTATIRTQLQAQLQENESVKEELDRLDADANIFKLIGPALIKQDLVEASSNVGKRLEYIKSEIERTEGQIKSLQTKMGDKEKEITRFQKKASAMG